MTDYLIERLRLSADRMATANCEMCHDAADALEARQARIAELEDLLGRYANCVADAEGVFFEPPGAEGEYIIELAYRADANAAPLPKPKPGQFSVPQSRSE